jgi:hypothetical protein
MPSSHIAALPCRKRLCDSFQLKPATPCGPYFAISVWYILADSIASGVSVMSLPLESVNVPP